MLVSGKLSRLPKLQNPSQSRHPPLSDDPSTSRSSAGNAEKRPLLLPAAKGSISGRFPGVVITPSFANFAPVWPPPLLGHDFLITEDFTTFQAFPSTFASTSGSRILLPARQLRLEIEYQRPCLTSASYYSPTMPFKSIFAQFCFFRLQNVGQN